MITFKHMIAPEAIKSAAVVVLRLMTENPSRDLQIVIHDVINEEVMASRIALDSAEFEALRFAVFDRYCALRAEAGLDEDHDADLEQS